ncbi:MAG: DegT/DnrJ/EryC1/StrS family aminotransferase [Armatimonadetes bacterium]|nr:DegT/DnrJ/EryC1/StrS family aminotransferase [Armatimonadota bacterium]
MKVSLADLRAQYYELKEQIDTAISEVIESGQFSGGPRVARLEQEVADFCGAKHGIGVASGTDALILALEAYGIGHGDEVITTPFSFGATSEAIARVGARPVYVDIDANTYNIQVDAIEAHITPKTKAILPVDLYGQMCDRSALQSIAEKHNLRLIIDSAQSIGASQYGIPIADGVDAATLSFYPTKNLGAYGDGGMILTSNDETAEILRSLRGHGTHGHKYHYVRVGYCSRLDAIQAVVLENKLPLLQGWNDLRRKYAHLYNTHLEAVAEQSNGTLHLPLETEDNCHIYHQYTIRHTRRDALQVYLKENEIASEIYYPSPLHLQPAYTPYGYREGDFPISEKVSNEVLSLPIHPELTEAQIDFVAEHIAKFQKISVPAPSFQRSQI